MTVVAKMEDRYFLVSEEVEFDPDDMSCLGYIWDAKLKQSSPALPIPVLLGRGYAWEEVGSAGEPELEKGGPGSGFFGHAGRPGEVGGSAPDGSGSQEGEDEQPDDANRPPPADRNVKRQERRRAKRAAARAAVAAARGEEPEVEPEPEPEPEPVPEPEKSPFFTGDLATATREEVWAGSNEEIRDIARQTGYLATDEATLNWVKSKIPSVDTPRLEAWKNISQVYIMMTGDQAKVNEDIAKEISERLGVELLPLKQNAGGYDPVSQLSEVKANLQGMVWAQAILGLGQADPGDPGFYFQDERQARSKVVTRGPRVKDMMAVINGIDWANGNFTLENLDAVKAALQRNSLTLMPGQYHMAPGWTGEPGSEVMVGMYGETTRELEYRAIDHSLTFAQADAAWKEWGVMKQEAMDYITDPVSGKVGNLNREMVATNMIAYRQVVDRLVDRGDYANFDEADAVLSAAWTLVRGEKEMGYEARDWTKPIGIIQVATGYSASELFEKHSALYGIREDTNVAAVRVASPDTTAALMASVDSSWDNLEHGAFTYKEGVVLEVIAPQVVQDAYDKAVADRDAEQKGLYHGTRLAVGQAIAATGFQVPKIAQTGRMMGDGVYLAENSSKSMQYFDMRGFGRGGEPRGTLLVVDAAMGQQIQPSKSIDYMNLGDSCYEPRGGKLALRNPEYRVTDPKAVIVRYIIDVVRTGRTSS